MLTNYQRWLEEDYQPIGGGALESNINGLWFGKQSAKGSPVFFGSQAFTGTLEVGTTVKSVSAFTNLVVGQNITGTGIPPGTTIAELKPGTSELKLSQAATEVKAGAALTASLPGKRGRWVGGDLQINRTDGEETWSDQTLFSDHVDFANTLVGSGAPVLQGSSGIISYLSWLSMGTDSWTTGTSEVQEFKSTAALTGGEFALAITIGVNTYKTGKIKITATQTEILEKICAAFPGAVWATTNVKVSSGATAISASNVTPMKLTFENELANQPIPTIEIVENTLTGGPMTNTKAATGKLPKHVHTPNSNGGAWYGIFKSVGKSVVYRSQFNDCRTQSLRIEGSSASKVVKVTPTVLSISPGIERKQTTDPVTLDEGLKPWIYTEAAGAFEIDGQIYHGQSAFALMFTWGLNEYYGDEVIPYDVINNTATATIEGLTLLIDAAGLERFNSQIYGTTAPAEGTAPLQGIPLLGSYKAEFKRIHPYTGATSEKFAVEMFGVKWAPTLAIPANPAGGAVELSFSGAMRKQYGGAYTKTTISGSPPFRVTTEYYKDNAEFVI